MSTFKTSKFKVIMLSIIVVTAVLGFVLRSKIGTAKDVYVEGGWTSVYYHLKDLSPWSTPNVKWDRGTPVDHGVSSEKLQQLWESMDPVTMASFLVVKDDKIIFEKYGPQGGPNTRKSISAIGKGITASLMLMLAVQDGLIDLDDRVSDFLPKWRNSADKQAITIRQLVTHSSGLDDVSFSRSDLDGWKKEYLETPSERFRLAIETTPTLFEPGSGFKYSGVGFYVLAYVLSDLYRDQPQPDTKQHITDRVMKPLGIPQHDWTISYGESYQVDDMTVYALGSGGSYSARAMARIGQLLLNGGRWNEQQILSAALVDNMLSYGGLPANLQSSIRHPAAAGVGVWSNCNGYWPSLPRDAVLGLGGSHNFILMIPSLNMVVVRQGALIPKTNPDQQNWKVIDGVVFRDLLAAVRPAAASEGRDPCGNMYVAGNRSGEG